MSNTRNMPSYLVCIQINSSRPEDYMQLNKMMRNIGFELKITGVDRKNYQLPTPIYRKHDLVDAGKLVDKIKTALKPKFGKPWVLVINYDEAVFDNLPII